MWSEFGGFALVGFEFGDVEGLSRELKPWLLIPGCTG
jgi:hypothetical protein